MVGSFVQDYDALTTYATGDVVEFMGSEYKCLVGGICSVPPTDSVVDIPVGVVIERRFLFMWRSRIVYESRKPWKMRPNLKVVTVNKAVD